MNRVLVTGAGGAAAVSFMKAVKKMDVEIYAADRDPLAAGLYLVPRARRLIVPDAELPSFAKQMLRKCRERQIDVLVPTVDAELDVLASFREEFSQQGTRLVLASRQTLRCLDKWTLLSMCRTSAILPRTEVFDSLDAVSTWCYPCIVKPRRGSGGRGVRIVNCEAELRGIVPSSELLIQEYLPGREYSVDVLADMDGTVVATVPRERLKVDSGVAVASQTVRDSELMLTAKKVAQAIGLQFMANIQFKRRLNGTPVLLEINPRFPGTLPLTVMAGVNMPEICLRYVLGWPVESPIPGFREVGVVRYLQEQFISPLEMEELQARHSSNCFSSEIPPLQAAEART